MAKYDAQIGELKNLVSSAKNVLIALPKDADIDKLASGLSLFLLLESQGKTVSVVCDEDIRVSQAHLFGVDHVSKTLPPTDGGNLTLTLEGVASADGRVPALEKLDWYAENNNLNLVFHVIPGQTFQPSRIVPKFSGAGFDLIFVVGAKDLNSLGNVYSQNPNAFSGTHIVDIDTDSTNTGFGQTNVLDPNSSSISEIVANLVSDLGLNLDADEASNLLAGIFEATNNLNNQKANADTFITVANLLRAGGKKPEVARPQNQPQPNLSALMPKTNQEVNFNQPAQPVAQQPVQQPVAPTQTPPPPGNEPTTEPLNPALAQAIHTAPPPPPAQNPVVTQPTDGTSNAAPTQQQPSPEEKPADEGTVTENPEPDWLTPKIFKGSSIG